MENIKSCSSCHIGSVNLPNNCHRCEESYCSGCWCNHEAECSGFISIGGIKIDPTQSIAVVKCPHCRTNICVSDYKHLFSEHISRIREIKSAIAKQTSSTVSSEATRKLSNAYYLSTAGDGEEIIHNRVYDNYKKELKSIYYTIWTNLLETHFSQECGKIKSSKPKRRKSDCCFSSCRNLGLTLNCSYCHLKYCTSHLLPEIHNCFDFGVRKTVLV